MRRAKTEAKRSQRSEVAHVEVQTPAPHGLAPARDDLADALTIGELEIVAAPALTIAVTLD